MHGAKGNVNRGHVSPLPANQHVTITLTFVHNNPAYCSWPRVVGDRVTTAAFSLDLTATEIGLDRSNRYSRQARSVCTTIAHVIVRGGYRKRPWSKYSMHLMSVFIDPGTASNRSLLFRDIRRRLQTVQLVHLNRRSQNVREQRFECCHRVVEISETASVVLWALTHSTMAYSCDALPKWF